MYFLAVLCLVSAAVALPVENLTPKPAPPHPIEEKVADVAHHKEGHAEKVFPGEDIRNPAEKLESKEPASHLIDDVKKHLEESKKGEEFKEPKKDEDFKEFKKDEPKENKVDNDFKESKNDEDKEKKKDKDFDESKKDEGKDINKDKDFKEPGKDEGKEIIFDKNDKESKKDNPDDKFSPGIVIIEDDKNANDGWFGQHEEPFVAEKPSKISDLLNWVFNLFHLNRSHGANLGFERALKPELQYNVDPNSPDVLNDILA